MRHTVTIHYLELTSPSELAAPSAPDPAFRVEQACIPSPELSRFLYATVGSPWSWYERLSWSREQWRAHLGQPSVETWLATLQGTPCGYFELQADAIGAVEISYLGLLPDFTGRGLGAELVAAAARRGFKRGHRVWLHTCDLDHPGALPNYVARGFRHYKRETRDIEIPEAVRIPLAFPDGSPTDITAP